MPLIKFFKLKKALAITLRDFINDVEFSHSHLRIYTGEANYMIWDEPSFIDTVERIVKRWPNLKIEVICGPVISGRIVVGTGIRHTALLDWAELGIVKLYKRETRGSESHFRVIDDKYARIEDYHRPMELPTEFKCHFTNNSEEIRKLTERFDEAVRKAESLRPKIGFAK